MNPGAMTCPPASIVRVAAPATAPTPAMLPSRTATEPAIDGPPVPSTMRALVMRRSNGFGGSWAPSKATQAAAPPSALRSLCERTRGLTCVVGDDDVRAGAADPRQRFQHRAALVDPPVPGGRLEHGVLAAHVVRRRGVAERLLHARDDVEIRQRRFDHHDVGAFLDILLYLAQRLARVRRVHLVRSAVAEPRCRSRGVAERAVERGAVFRRIRHDGDLLEAALVERLADRADPPVHHVRRRDDVCAARRRLHRRRAAARTSPARDASPASWRGWRPTAGGAAAGASVSAMCGCEFSWASLSNSQRSTLKSQIVGWALSVARCALRK